MSLLRKNDIEELKNLAEYLKEEGSNLRAEYIIDLKCRLNQLLNNINGLN